MNARKPHERAHINVMHKVIRGFILLFLFMAVVPATAAVNPLYANCVQDQLAAKLDPTTYSGQVRLKMSASERKKLAERDCGIIFTPSTYETKTKAVPPAAPPPKKTAKPTEEKSEGPACGKNFLSDLKSEKEKPKSKPSPFTALRGVPIDSDSAQNLVSAVENLQSGKTSSVSTVVQGKFNDGNAFSVGLLKQSDGSVVFTVDGTTYHDSPKDVLRPGFFTKLGDGLSKFKKGFLGLFGVGTYTGKETAGDADAQKKGQLQLDAASAALESLQKSAKDPEKQEGVGKEAIDRFHGGTENLLNGQFNDVLLDEIKATTGCDLPFIKKVLSGEIVDAIVDKGALIRQLQTFPAQSVITMAKEIRAASFANAARLYIEERESGKSPSAVTKLLRDGQLERLDFASSIKGVGQEFAKGALLNAYEETYQRYLLAKNLGK